jgi:putative flippase GtrA
MKFSFAAGLTGSHAMQIRFLLVGGSITLFDVAFCAILTLILPPNLAYCLSFATAVALRFWLDRHFTFRSLGGKAMAQFAKYWFSCSVTMIVGIVAFNGLQTCGVPLILSKIGSVIPVTLLGYVLFRFFVFGRQAEEAKIVQSPQWSEEIGADRA